MDTYNLDELPIVRSVPAYEVLHAESPARADEVKRRVEEPGLFTEHAAQRTRQAYPRLDDAAIALMLFDAWLRQHHGNSYRLIRNPSEFQRRYDLSRLRARNGVSASQYAPEYARYDISEVAAPVLDDDIFRCYLEDPLRGLPYRVEIPWPASETTVVEFALLPMMEDDDDWI